MSTSPVICVLNLAGLGPLLRDAGFVVVDGDPTDVTTQAASLWDEKRPYVVIAALTNTQLRTWATLQAANRVPVLCATSEVFPSGASIPGARVVTLPATGNEIMAQFGAKPRPVLETTLNADGTVDVPAPDDSVFAVFSNIDEPETPSSPFAEPEPVAPSSPFAEPVPVAPTSPFAPETPAEAPQSPSEPFGAPTSPFAPETPAEAPQGPSEPFGFSRPAEEPSPPAASEPLDVETPTPPPSGFGFGGRPEAPEAPPVGSVVADSVFTTSGVPPARERRAVVIVVFAGKGGVGKSTTALSLAERAALQIPNYRTVVVDANRGQGDLRTFLKLTESHLKCAFNHDGKSTHRPWIPPNSAPDWNISQREKRQGVEKHCQQCGSR